MFVHSLFRSLPHEYFTCIVYGSVVCLHPLMIIGAPTRGYLCNCTGGQSEKDLSRIELLHVAFQV